MNINRLIIICLLITFSGTFAQPLDSVWTFHWYNSYFTDAIETPSGTYIISGVGRIAHITYPFANWHEVSSSGELIRNSSRTHARSDALILHPLSGFLVGGYIDSDSSSGTDICLTHIDSAGDTVWTNSYPREGRQYLKSIEIVNDSSYVLVCEDALLSPVRSILLLGVNAVGEEVWSTLVADISIQGIGRRVAMDDSGFVIVGATALEQNENDFLIARFDFDGNLVWSQTNSNAPYDALSAVVASEDGGYYAVGRTGVSYDSTWSCVVRFDENGDWQWTRVHESGSASDLLPTTDGNLVYTGEIYRDRHSLFQFVEISTEGNVARILELEPPIDPDTYDLRGTALCASSNGGYLVVGASGDFDWPLYDCYAVRLVPSTGNNPLHQNIAVIDNLQIEAYPNPFNSITTLSLSLPGVSDVDMSLYDITGRYVKSIAQQRMPAGEHSLNVDAAGLPSGTYFVKAQAGEFSAVKIIVLVK